MGKITISALLLSLSLAASALAAGRPMTVNDLLAMDRVSEPQLSADGARAVYSVAVPDLAANRLIRNIWLVTLGTGDSKALTTTGRDGGARWSPSGSRSSRSATAIRSSTSSTSQPMARRPSRNA